MLQTIRDRASGWVAYAIIFLISIPFALWGIQEYFGGGKEDVVAEVSGTEITVREFNNQFQQQKRYLQSVLGNDLEARGLNDASIKQSVLQRLVRNELLRQEADQAGYRVSNAALFERIKTIPAFQVEGVFNKARYQQALQSQRRSSNQFEAQLREEIRLSQFDTAIRQSSFLPAAYARDYNRLKNQTRDFSYFVVSADVEAARAQITDDEVATYYERNAARFQTQERVKLAYIELNQQALVDTVSVDEEAVREYYDQQADRFMIPQQRQARHILLAVPLEAADEHDQAKRQKKIDELRQQAEELVKRLHAGEDFAALASQYSSDSISAQNGGDLGLIVAGDMGPRFEAALFALAKDQISAPVETDFGFHIIQVTGIKPAVQKPFEEVRLQAEQELKQQLAEDRYADLAQQLLTLSYEQPDSLEPVADALELKLNSTDWLTRATGQGIASETSVRSAAFGEEVLGEGRNSDLIELADGRALVVRVVAHEPATTRPLEDVKDQIRNVMAAQVTRQQALEEGRALLKDLQAGAMMASLTASGSRELKSVSAVARGSQDVPAAIVRKVFTIQKPQPEKASYAGVSLANGDYAVIALQKINDAAPQDTDTAVTAQQSAYIGTRELDAAYQGLESAADVNIHEDKL